jgi:hypothetical protein
VVRSSALRASWAVVSASKDKDHLYSHLFVSPELRSMLPIQMTGQRDKFVTALGLWSRTRTTSMT